MEESIDNPANPLLTAGILLGRNQAFGIIAGRCSATQVADLRRLRDEKLYQRCTPRWNDFCPRYLKMSGSQADRIIHYMEEFGPAYFEMAQLVRISPHTYRAIQPLIQGGALHHNGEVIELNPDNAQRVAEAVAGIRRTLPPKSPAPPREMHRRIEALDRHCTEILAEFQHISNRERCGENWLQFTAVLDRVSQALLRLRSENGI